MKNITLFIALFIGIQVSLTQNNDSIIIQLNNLQFNQVLDKIKKLESQGVNTGDICYFKALAYKGLFKINDAINSAEQSLKFDSTSMRTRFLLADLYTTSGQIRSAIATYNGIINIDSSNIQANMKLANLLFQQQKYFEASGYYYYLSNFDTTNWFVLRQMAICFEEMKTPHVFPIENYLKVLELNPKDQISVTRLARIYISEDNYKEAVKLTNKFLELDSLNTTVLRLSGYSYLHMGEPDTALIQLQKCVALNDTSFFVYKFLGLSYFNKNDYEPSINYLTKAYKIDSTDIHTTFFLGASCGRLYYKQKGIDYLNNTLILLQADKNMVTKVYKELAATYQSFSKYEEAGNALAEALEINPKDRDLLLHIGRNFDRNLKDYESAIQYYSMYLDSTKADIDTLGSVYYKRLKSERRINQIKEEKFWEGK